jgi:hypothetical protein
VDFAKELETQLNALERPADRLAVLSETTLPLGEFNEALALRVAHLNTVVQMRDLLRKVRDALAFAENVTLAVATGYKEFDEEVAASYRSAPVPVVTQVAAGQYPAGQLSAGEVSAGTMLTGHTSAVTVPAGTVSTSPTLAGTVPTGTVTAGSPMPALGTGTVYYSSTAPINVNVQAGGTSDV